MSILIRPCFGLATKNQQDFGILRPRAKRTHKNQVGLPNRCNGVEGLSPVNVSLVRRFNFLIFFFSLFSFLGISLAVVVSSGVSILQPPPYVRNDTVTLLLLFTETREIKACGVSA